MATKQQLKVGGKSIAVSNLEKVLYPGTGFTKAQVIDYYVRVSKFLLPHLRNRPVTMKRYPDGVKGQFFYEKDAPGYTPEWVKTFPVPRRAGGGNIDYILINDLPTLVWCANLANLEIHPFLHRAPRINSPTSIVFDLDPGEGADVLTCAEVGRMLRETLDGMKLESFPKVSGSKGIQVYAPLNTAVTYDVTQPFARTVAEYLERQRPDLVISKMAKEARKGKVFIDWSQNAEHKTTAGVYSLRAKRERPFVSMPVRWEELERALDAGNSDGLYFEPDAAISRLEQIGDLFEPVLKLKQKVPSEFGKQIEARRARPPKALDPYKAKRDFSKTPEPGPEAPRRSRQGGRRRFVIQKHAASRLHYDFRLEMDDVLKSWAVPKGPPYERNERRLAMATEDHPMDYLQFEGIIPEGQYGGGTVMVWDIGTYELMEGNYYKGKLHLYLEGTKLKGEWVLVKDRSREKNWYLMKAGESMKPLPAKKDDTSAITGRSMAQIADARDAEWQSNRASTGDLAHLPDARVEFVEPMLAKAVTKLPEGADWQYEIKLDGYRALAVRDAERLTLFSRNGNDLNSRFPSVAQALEALPPGTILDGEVAALDADGRPSFNILQNYQATEPVFYYVFDLVAYGGKSLMDLPLRERRALLEGRALAGLRDPIRLSGTLQASAADLIAAVKKQGLEGIVAKRADSRYEAGRRSGAWSKFRVAKGRELIIGGYMPGAHGFESLLVGYYEGDKLMFNAKVRNGFAPGLKEDVFKRLKELETKVCPFANLPEPKNARRGEALTADVMKKCRWVKPELAARIEFTDWTATNHLRHSRFAGLLAA